MLSGEETNKEEKRKYNGFESVKDESGFWKTETDNGIIATTYTPSETENILINFDISLLSIYQKPIYYVPETNEDVSEIFRNLDIFALRFQEACLEGRNCENENVVVKTCSDNVFVFSESENIKIYKQENCIFIEAPLNEQIRASDRLIFKIFGIQ